MPDATVPEGSRPVLDALAVVPLLCELGVVSDADLVDAFDLQVTDISRRNRNFAVTGLPGGALVLKHGATPDTRATVERESTVYRTLWALGAPVGRPHPLPRLVAEHCERCVVAITMVGRGESLLNYCERTRRLRPNLFASLGQALGWLHRSTAVPDVRHRCEMTLDCSLPGALTLHRPTVDFYAHHASAANLRAIEIVQSEQVLVETFERFAADWRPTCLIHGDMRLDNVVVGEPPSSSDVAIVDWELATVGDPAWDLGCVLGDALSLWVRSAPTHGESVPSDVSADARLPLPAIHEALAAFWRAYLATVTEAPGAAERGPATCIGDLVPRSIACSAVRLVQASIEMTQEQSELSTTSVFMLQLAANIAERPQAAAATLFGLREAVR